MLGGYFLRGAFLVDVELDSDNSLLAAELDRKKSQNLRAESPEPEGNAFSTFWLSPLFFTRP